MTLPAEILADTPQAYWKFNETSGTTFTDYSGNGRHGTYPGTGVTLAYAAGPSTTGDLGARFNGGTGTVPSFPGSASFTIEAWVQRISITWNYPGIMELGSNMNHAGQGGWLYYYAEDVNDAWAFKRNSPDGGAPTTGGGTIGFDLVHLVITYDSVTETYVWYIDGVAVGGTPSTYNFGTATITDTIYFGVNQEYSNANSDFLISHAAIYDHVLTAARVQAHFNAGGGSSGIRITHSDSGAFSEAEQVLVSVLNQTETYRWISLGGGFGASNPLPSSWSSIGYDDSSWNSGPAWLGGFGSGLPLPQYLDGFLVRTTTVPINNSWAARGHFTLNNTIGPIRCHGAADNSFEAYINGHLIASGSNTLGDVTWDVADVSAYCISGDNVFAIYITTGGDEPNGGTWFTAYVLVPPNDALILPTSDVEAYVFENVGLVPISTAEVQSYAYTNAVSGVYPDPHLWYVHPSAANPGDIVTAVGTGFGHTQVEESGEVVFHGEVPYVTSWLYVPAGTDAYDSARSILPGTDVASPEHERVAFLVPNDAQPGYVTVAVNPASGAAPPPAPPTDFDFAVFAEHESVSAALTTTESAAFAETSALTASVSSTDTGAFTETEMITVSSSDSAAFAESQTASSVGPQVKIINGTDPQSNDLTFGSISVSPDGTKRCLNALSNTTGNETFWTSTDKGQTWTELPGTGPFPVDVSGVNQILNDGTILYLGHKSTATTGINFSKYSGGAWSAPVQLATYGSGTQLGIFSADGTNIWAYTSSGTFAFFWPSTNGGTTFPSTVSGINSSSVDMVMLGTRIYVVQNGDFCFYDTTNNTFTFVMGTFPVGFSQTVHVPGDPLSTIYPCNTRIVGGVWKFDLYQSTNSGGSIAAIVTNETIANLSHVYNGSFAIGSDGTLRIYGDDGSGHFGYVTRSLTATPAYSAFQLIGNIPAGAGYTFGSGNMRSFSARRQDGNVDNLRECYVELNVSGSVPPNEVVALL